MRLFIIASRGTHSLELFCLWPAGLVCQRAEMMGPPCCSAIRAELHSSLNCFDKHSLTIFLCFHRFLVNLNTCPAGVLGWYRSPAKGPTPSTLYLLFFPALSDTASQVACYSLFSFISMFSYPSDLSPFFYFLLPCATSAWSSVSSWISDFNSQLFFHHCHHLSLPKEGLIFDTSYF